MKYIKSENFLCFATLIEMILNDIGIQKYTRFDIAEELGITLPLSERGIIKNANYSEDKFDWGICVDSEKLNSFFKMGEINLQSKYIYATPYTMLKQETLNWDKCYVIFLFSYGELTYNIELQEIGHSVLFIDMPNSREVRIYDPGPKESGEKNVDCYRMEEAMYQRRAGYIIIHEINS